MSQLRGQKLFLVWKYLFPILVLVAGFLLAIATASAQESSSESQSDAQCGILAYAWQGEVTKGDRGFPRQQPPESNFDWTSPVNYAQGTLHLRAEVIKQPVVQEDMFLQLCFWQPTESNPGYPFGLETCSRQMNVEGSPGNVVTWSQDIGAMWKLNGTPLDWDRPRYRSAVAIKNGRGQPVSDYNGWNWYGEDPDDWYPLNMQFVGRVTPPGTLFAGWDICLSPTALTINSLEARASHHRREERTLLSLGLLLLSLTGGIAYLRYLRRAVR